MFLRSFLKKVSKKYSKYSKITSIFFSLFCFDFNLKKMSLKLSQKAAYKISHKICWISSTLASLLLICSHSHQRNFKYKKSCIKLSIPFKAASLVSHFCGCSAAYSLSPALPTQTERFILHKILFHNFIFFCKIMPHGNFSPSLWK